MDAPLVTIRRAVPGDARRVSIVGQATFLETFAGILDGDDILQHCEGPHAVAQYAQALESDDTRLWLAETEHGKTPVGYLMTTSASTLPLADVGAADLEVKRIYVLHRFHGAGVGPALMRCAIDEARATGKDRVLIGVYSKNDRAIAFYKKNDFSIVGTRRFKVGSNHYDDFILGRRLGG
jgi:ribosomal protein S18 acetylase RimI-like enzyme